MPNKNEIMTLTASGYTSEGEGVCRADGFVVFVPGLLQGESARVQLLKVKKTYGYGKIVELLNKSPHRKESDCASFPQCGGCKLRHMSYEEELRFKKGLVSDALERLGGLSLVIHDVTPSPQQKHYRNKAQLPVGLEKGEPAVGFYAARSHRLVPCHGCYLQDERTDLAVDALLQYMKEQQVAPYDEKTHRGLIRHLYLRFGSKSGDVLVCVVTNGRKLPCPQRLCELMVEALGEGITVVQNVNREKTNVVMGLENIPLLGDGNIVDELCGLAFVISPHSFFQVNHAQTEQLYQKALELSHVTKEETVLDLYCGIGTMTLLFARQAKQVYGVELVPQAVENAKENAKRNGISNASFYCSDAAQAAEKFAGKGIDLVVIDPPRSGCDPQLIASIQTIFPNRIVYVSCNPATLARDLKQFEELGYHAKEAFPFDMFPGTSHVETVVLMSRTKN